MTHWTQTDNAVSPGLLLGRVAIARFLGISPRTLDRIRERHALPILRLDFHRIFSTRQALNAWFTEASLQNLDIETRDSVQQIVAGFGKLTGARDV